ncbi:hypothetical protein KJN74_05820 [Candidatus Bathyarchaeota archaeon]|nr:hypothetical protein [Candidatus Bathyarchaeota archaeon]
MSKEISIQENVVQRKVIFFKSSFEIKTIRNRAEKIKNQMFKKYFFFKSKPEESKINTIDKYFEPYIVIDGKYSIDYSKNWKFSIKVDEEMQILKINNKNFEPNFLKNHKELSYKRLELQGIGRYYHEERKRIIFDQKWNEVRLDILPYLPFEEEKKQIPNNIVDQQLTKDLKIKKEVQILKSKILQRPDHISKIHNETLKINERALVFKPMYNITATHTKTQKEVTFQIDGVNGKIVSERKGKMNFQGKKNIKEIGLKIYSTSKAKTQQLFNYLKKSQKRVHTNLQESNPKKS